MLSMSAAVALPRRHDVPAIRFALIERSGQPGTWGTFRDGVALGYLEAKRTALLFPQARLELVDPLDHGVPVSVRGMPELLAKRGARVILAALGDDDALSIAKDCDRLKIIFINCGARADALRRDVCSPYVFHVQASDAMYAAAAKIAGSESNIVLWDASLEKYGASQLNDRFRAGSGTGMDAAGWAGWFAIKVIWESLLRAKSDEVAALAYYMSSGPAQYDGHKGAPLSFRSWDRQLRQPLFSIANVKKAGHSPIREIPDVGRSSAPVRELLDTIGDGPAESMCKAQ